MHRFFITLGAIGLIAVIIRFYFTERTPHYHPTSSLSPQSTDTLTESECDRIIHKISSEDDCNNGFRIFKENWEKCRNHGTLEVYYPDLAFTLETCLTNRHDKEGSRAVMSWIRSVPEWQVDFSTHTCKSRSELVALEDAKNRLVDTMICHSKESIFDTVAKLVKNRNFSSISQFLAKDVVLKSGPLVGDSWCSITFEELVTFLQSAITEDAPAINVDPSYGIEDNGLRINLSRREDNKILQQLNFIPTEKNESCYILSGIAH